MLPQVWHPASFCLDENSKLDVLLVRKYLVLYEEVRNQVRDKQDRVKAYSDTMLSAKQSALKAGDRDRVRIPFPVKKGEQKFSRRKKVVQQKGPN